MPVKMNPSSRLPKSDILKGLPAGVSEYRYSGPQNLIHIVDHESRLRDSARSTVRYIILFDATWGTLNRDPGNSSEPDILKYIDSVDLVSEIVLLKIPSMAHARAGSAFTDILREMLVQAKLNEELESFAEMDVQGSTKQKRSNQAFLPAVLPDGRSNTWPSMTVETGYSESKAKLEVDSRWWLTESNGDVKAVLTISLNPSKRECVLDLWRRQERATRSDDNRMAPAVDQHVVISQGSPEKETKVSNTLIVAFEDLFLREKNQDDKDLVFEKEDLRRLAETTWKYQEF